LRCISPLRLRLTESQPPFSTSIRKRAPHFGQITEGKHFPPCNRHKGPGLACYWSGPARRRCQPDNAVGSYPTNVRDWPKPSVLPATVDEATTTIAIRDNPRILTAQNTLFARETWLATANGTGLPTVDFVINWSLAGDRILATGQGTFDSYSSNDMAKSRATNYTIGIKLNTPPGRSPRRSQRSWTQRESRSPAMNGSIAMDASAEA
jgi:hypothetical protein